MGVSLKVLDPSEEVPAAVAARHVAGHFREAADIMRFAQARCHCCCCLPACSPACPTRSPLSECAAF